MNTICSFCGPFELLLDNQVMCNTCFELFKVKNDKSEVIGERVYKMYKILDKNPCHGISAIAEAKLQYMATTHKN